MGKIAKCLIKIVILPIIIFMPIFAYFLSNISYAETTCYTKGENYHGRDRWCGYFKNVDDRHGTDVLPEIENGQALPSSSIDSVSSLISFLRTYNSSGNAQKKVGSALIVNTMLGRDAPGNGTLVSEADFKELEARLNYIVENNKGEIKWNAIASGDINSYYQGDDSMDDAFYLKYRSANAIVIIDKDGNTVYQLLRRCANPLGNLPGIPTVPEVPKTYNLSPSITASPTLVSVGGTVTLNSTITYSGDVSSPASTTWKIYKRINNGSFNEFASGTGSISKTTSFTRTDSLSSGLTVGTKVCYQLGVYPQSNDNSNELKSGISCITVSDKPKVQVLGGDLMVGGLANTSTSTISGSTYGSWDEYGILAGKSISGMASAAAFAGGFSGSINTASSYSKLSFNNTNNTNSNCKSSSTIGCYLTSTSLPDVASSFTTTSSTPVLSSGSLTSVASGVYKINSNISISASTITKGKWIVINAVGKTITITGDIKYTDDTLHSISEIPQVIIIADNINISDSVTNIDSWLIAKNGYINTCSAVAIGEKLSSNVCNKQLTVNGPVVANQLYLRRTYTGTGDTPAEIFNLPEDAYLWSYAHASDNTRIQTVYTTELPPRL